jgi:tetratricopeptide (TPR) repeat protein
VAAESRIGRNACCSTFEIRTGMTLLDRLLNRVIRLPTAPPALWRTDHPARERIREAAAIADRVFHLHYTHGRVLVEAAIPTARDGELTRAIGRALQLAPDDPDLLFARAEAEAAQGNAEAARELRERVLRLRPDHFDAGMRQRHPEEWPHLYTYPAWSEQTTTVPPTMLALEAAGHAVQIVRDTLSLSPLVLMPLPGLRSPGDVQEYHWHPRWIETPHGPVFRCTVVLRSASGAVHRRDLFLSPYPVEPIAPQHGNWLIHRFCNAAWIFLVWHDDEEVLFNRRLMLSPEVRQELATIRRSLARLELPPDHAERVRRAVAWGRRALGRASNDTDEVR